MHNIQHANLLQVFELFNIDVSGIKLPAQLGHLQNDSRDLQANDVFCAVIGSLSDGREYIDSAIDKQCALVIKEVEEQSLHGQINADKGIYIISVYQLNSRLFELCEAYYQSPQSNMKIIGITGTNGKTSTCQLIAQLLTNLGEKVAIIGTNGAGMQGDLKPIANTTPGATELHQLFYQFNQQGAAVVVMEVSSHALEQKRVNADLFDAAVFTNLSRDHLDYHQTMDAYGAAKFKIFNESSKQIKVLNVDDLQGSKWFNTIKTNKVGFSCKQNNNQTEYLYSANDIEHGNDGVSFNLSFAEQTLAIQTPLIGDFNVENVLAAISLLLQWQYPAQEVKQACQALKPVTGRMELFGISGYAHAVVDYAHTPDALENALNACRQHCKGELWVVFGCGGDRDKGKRPQMGEIACKLADKVVITNDNPRSESPQQIADEIAVGCTQKNKISVMLSRQEAVLNTLAKAKEDDMVLLAGKGHEDYIVLGNKKHFYSERETVQSYFASKVAR